MATGTSFNINGNAAQSIATGLKHAAVQNRGPYSVYLGGSGVTDTTGVEIAPTGQIFPVPIGLAALEQLYAIADSGAGANTSDVRVLTSLG